MKKNKRGMIMGMSFGVIFSIILIIFFIMITFIAINAFLNTKDCAKIGIFLDSFQSNVDKAWNSQSDDFKFKGSLPSKLDFICFYDMEDSLKGSYNEIGFELGRYKGTGANFFFYPTGKACNIPRHIIKHVDLELITEKQNPSCIPLEKGIVNLRIKKGFNDRFVTVTAD